LVSQRLTHLRQTGQESGRINPRSPVLPCCQRPFTVPRPRVVGRDRATVPSPWGDVPGLVPGRRDRRRGSRRTGRMAPAPKEAEMRLPPGSARRGLPRRGAGTAPPRSHGARTSPGFAGLCADGGALDAAGARPVRGFPVRRPRHAARAEGGGTAPQGSGHGRPPRHAGPGITGSEHTA
jgi:hypothetical protein